MSAKAATDGRPGRPQRLADRLTRALIMALAAVWLVCVLGVSWFIYRVVNSNFDNELIESAHRLVEVAIDQYDRSVAEQGGAARASFPITARLPVVDSTPLVYQLVDEQGRVLLRAPPAPITPFGVPNDEGFHDRGEWRIYVAAYPGRALYLQLADPLAERTDVLVNALLTLVSAMVLVLLALAFVLRHVARRELRVLERLQYQIAQRNGSDLSPIDVSRMPAEPRAVGEDVNRMLQRLSQALDVERALAANAAHELRTPLAAAMLRLQAALDQQLSHADVQAALEALKTLAHRTEKLLQLSRAESASALTQQPVDLDALVETVAGEFWHTDDARRRLDVVSSHEQPVRVLGDADTLALVIRNLVENALRYSAGAKVEIEVQHPATLMVRDFGPGVDAARIQTLLQRHVRQAQDRAGYGLGMSITASIVSRHHGQLALMSPPPDHPHGFEARVTLTPCPS